MKFALSLVTVMTLTLTACGKKETEAVDRYGACKQSVVDSFNVIHGNAEAFQLSSDPAYLKTASQECASFGSLLGGQSCDMLVNDVKTTVTKGDTDAICAKVNQTLKALSRTQSSDSSDSEMNYSNGSSQKNKKRTGSKKPRVRGMEMTDGLQSADLEQDSSEELAE
jgi:hypothetical protein